MTRHEQRQRLKGSSLTLHPGACVELCNTVAVVLGSSDLVSVSDGSTAICVSRREDISMFSKDSSIPEQQLVFLLSVGLVFVFSAAIKSEIPYSESVLSVV